VNGLHGMPVLKPWRRSWMLTETRTTGEIKFRKNGTSLEIWIRINGKPQRFSVTRAELLDFLNSPYDIGRDGFPETTLHADSDGNTEETDVKTTYA
jgi:hypothetical protein